MRINSSPCSVENAIFSHNGTRWYLSGCCLFDLHMIGGRTAGGGVGDFQRVVPTIICIIEDQRIGANSGSLDREFSLGKTHFARLALPARAGRVGALDNPLSRRQGVVIFDKPFRGLPLNQMILQYAGIDAFCFCRKRCHAVPFLGRSIKCDVGLRHGRQREFW